MAAAGQQIAEGEPHRDAPRFKERVIPPLDAHAADGDLVSIEVDVGDARGSTHREPSALLQGKAQQLVARCDNEGDRDYRGQQADPKALAHVVSFVLNTAHAGRYPPG